MTPPAQRVQFILGEDIDADGQTLESHPLFSEMEELFKDGDDLEWKETARWVKFEEDVEEGNYSFTAYLPNCLHLITFNQEVDDLNYLTLTWHTPMVAMTSQQR